jgi:hypothetical protein
MNTKDMLETVDFMKQLDAVEEMQKKIINMLQKEIPPSLEASAALFQIASTALKDSGVPEENIHVMIHVLFCDNCSDKIEKEFCAGPTTEMH